MSIRTAISALLCCLSVGTLHAQSMAPGLWEISSSRMQLEGQNLPDMQSMLAIMPAEQRQMMSQLLSQHGVDMSDQGVRVCLTEQQIKANQLPLQGPAANCQQEIISRTDSLWTFRFNCPEGQGKGEVHFANPREFSSQVEGSFNHAGTARQGSMESRGRWIQADCGRLQPVH